MGNSLMNYLNKRLKEENTFDKGRNLAGPVITISREVGCNGLVLARLMAAKLNKPGQINSWKVLSKEIFHESAKELDMEPEMVRQTFKKHDRYAFEQILKAFSDKRYISEEKIIKTVRDVVRTLAIDGHNIIVGRAGHIITSDIRNALHIRLIAPKDYRVSTIMRNNKLTKNEALDFIDKVEKERKAFRKALKENSLKEKLFDLTINRASFSNEEAVELIQLAMEKKGILKDYEQKIEFY